MTINGFCIPLCSANVQIASVNSNLNVKRLGYEQGLSHSVVTAITQDQKGYLWVGTQFGLNKYNGVNFTHFYSEKEKNDSETEKHSIQDNYITSLFTDSSGNVWVSTIAGLGYFDTKMQFNPIVLEENQPAENFKLATKFIQDKNGVLWIATHKGLWRKEPDKKAVRIKLEPSPFGHINDLAIDNQNKLWIATLRGLYSLNILENKPQLFTHDNAQNWIEEEVVNIEFIDGVLWLYRLDGLWRFNSETRDLIKIPSPAHNVVTNVYDMVYSAGGFWLSSNSGLWFFSVTRGDWTNYRAQPLSKTALPSNRLRNLFVDQQKLLWIGSFGAGLSVRHPQSQNIQHWLNQVQIAQLKFENFTPADVTGISEDNQNNIWVSTRGNGVFKLSKNGKIIEQISIDTPIKIATDIVEDVYVDQLQQVWIATGGKGLYRLNDKGKIQHFSRNSQKHSEFSLQSSRDYIYDLYQDRMGRLWLATHAGVELFDTQTNRLITKPEFTPQKMRNVSARVSAISQTLDGTLWIGGDAGLVGVNEQTNKLESLTTHSEDNALTNDDVNALSEDSSGNLWVGTASGLNRVSRINGKWVVKQYNHVKQLKNKPVYALVSDKKGQIWMGGNQGLIRFNPATEEVLALSKNMGLHLQEFNPGSSLSGSNGYLYLGGVNGFHRFRANNFSFAEFTPFIELSGLWADGKRLSLIPSDNDSYTIPGNTHLVRMKFDVLDLAQGKSTLTRIRVPEMSEQWYEWSEGNIFTINDLPAGEYLIEIESKSLISPKIKNSKKITIKITRQIKWMDYLFSSVMVFMVLLLVLYLNRKKQVWKHEKLHLLNSRETKKTQIIELQKKIEFKKQENSKLIQHIDLSHKEFSEFKKQFGQLHLLDGQTGLHTKEFVTLSIEKIIRQLLTNYLVDTGEKSSFDDSHLPKLAFIFVKIDEIDKLRQDGGQYLVSSVSRQVAKVLKKSGVSPDELARWDDDNFLILAQCNKSADIDVLCERLTKLLSEKDYGPSKQEQFSISCSLAATEFPFVSGNPLEFDWNKLLEFSSVGLKLIEQYSGSGWVVIRSANRWVNQFNIREARYNMLDFIKSEQVKLSSSFTLDK